MTFTRRNASQRIFLDFPHDMHARRQVHDVVDVGENRPPVNLAPNVGDSSKLAVQRRHVRQLSTGSSQLPRNPQRPETRISDDRRSQSRRLPIHFSLQHRLVNRQRFTNYLLYRKLLLYEPSAFLSHSLPQSQVLSIMIEWHWQAHQRL